MAKEVGYQIPITLYVMASDFASALKFLFHDQWEKEWTNVVSYKLKLPSVYEVLLFFERK